jgi:hypothetical protein
MFHDKYLKYKSLYLQKKYGGSRSTEEGKKDRANLIELRKQQREMTAPTPTETTPVDEYTYVEPTGFTPYKKTGEIHTDYYDVKVVKRTINRIDDEEVEIKFDIDVTFRAMKKLHSRFWEAVRYEHTQTFKLGEIRKAREEAKDVSPAEPVRGSTAAREEFKRLRRRSTEIGHCPRTEPTEVLDPLYEDE